MEDVIDTIDSSLVDTKKKKKSGGFQSMNLISSVYRAIVAKGFNVPTPIQRRVIPLILEGRDVVASSKTGSGKTAAYMIPILNRLKSHSSVVGCRVLILLPTRELALQTASVFKQFARFTDIVHAVIVGGHGFEGQYESLASNPDVIIATPGRLMQHLNETHLSLSKIEYFVIDEVDQMFEMGCEEQLRTILNKLPHQRQTILLSATLPEVVSEFVKAGLKDYIFVKLDSEYSIPDTMKLHFFVTKSQQKLSAMIYFLREILDLKENSIIFAATRYHVDYLVEILKEFGIASVGIYGKLDQLTRKEQIFKFKKGDVKLMIVTDLAARGIDIPFVNNVINWDFPTKPKLFVHRAGRTARAGKRGTTYTFLNPDEVLYLADLKLYMGKNLQIKGPLDDYNLAHYGQIPGYLLDNYEEAIKTALKHNIELEKMEELCNRAIKLFKKTRASASKSSIRGARELDQSSVHQLFQDKGYDSNLEKVFADLKNYRPKQSYLEFKNDTKQIILNTSALNFITKARTATEKYKQKKEMKKRMQADLADIEDENEEDFENIDDQIGDDEYENIEDGGIDAEDDGDNDDVNDESDVEEPKKKEPSKPAKDTSNKRKAKDSDLEEDFKKDNKKGNAKSMQPKKVKKSAQSDFKKHSEYISNEPSKNNEFQSNDKISREDIVPFITADDNEDLIKRKKYTWDKAKKNYVVNQDKARLQSRKDKEDKTMKKDKSKKTFEVWQKKNKMHYQRVGEVENKEIINKAKQLFRFRRTKREEDAPVRNELQRPEQILKTKKKTIAKKHKNTKRGARAGAKRGGHRK